MTLPAIQDAGVDGIPAPAAPVARACQPIGVFDSGIGGISVLRALRAELPQEDFVYVADSGHAPYGEREDGFVLQRAQAITDWLRRTHQIKALVVACNTATAAAIAALRAAWPDLPLVGIEPALKPAAAHSHTGRVGVMATRGTLQSEKFRALQASLQGQATFVLQPCDGLADAIERDDAAQISALCARYTQAMGRFGHASDAIDTLVLGCTHYPLIEAQLRDAVGSNVSLLEGGAPVARQTRKLLAQQQALTMAAHTAGSVQWFSTGNPAVLAHAAQRWLQTEAQVQAL